jgi:outer membrane protein assembly factor BamD
MKRNFLLLVIVIVLAGGCKFQKLRKNGTWEEKYAKAMEYYEEKDYYRSNVLLEDILPIIRGTKEAELANFYYPYTYFYQDQFILSAHYFNLFTEVYSRSEYAMEAQFMHAFSLYQQSPEYKLDQTSTYEAIAALQNFINSYPYSEFAARADSIIDELQVKLEYKAYMQAKLYNKIGQYKSAAVTFDNFTKDYPDSKYNEEILFLSIRNWYDYAMISIRSKQEERFTNAIELYEKFIDQYENSEYLKDAEQIYTKSLKELSNFADRNNTNNNGS